jgi:hypothetical protein
VSRTTAATATRSTPLLKLCCRIPERGRPPGIRSQEARQYPRVGPGFAQAHQLLGA